MTPYRVPGEKEPEPPIPFDWMNMLKKIWIIIQVIFWVSLAGLVVYGCNDCIDTQQAETAARRSKCDIETAQSSFKVQRWNEEGTYAEAEGFFSTRPEAEAYIEKISCPMVKYE